MGGRQLKEIFRAFHAHDELSFRRAAIEIIEEEQAKHHNALARDLQRLLVVGSDSVSLSPVLQLPPPPTDREGDWPLAEVREPRLLFEDLVLAPEPQRAFAQLSTEAGLWQEFDARAIPRRQRILLYGPPGCGKTSAAEAMAGELGWPLLIVRIDSVVSSYLGETASNLRRIIDYASQNPFVVLFDEFDSLGRSRTDQGEHGEMKRVVTAFLQMIDRYSGPSLILAATNHEELLDAALWRRFDEVVEMKLPTVHQIRALIRLELRGIPHSSIDIDRWASSLRGKPHAAVSRLVQDARRSALLRGSESVTDDDFSSVIRGITSRPW